MPKVSFNNQGFAKIFSILGALALFLVLMFVADEIMAPPDKKFVGGGKTINFSIPYTSCSRKFSPQVNVGPYYLGPLFDAHFHLPATAHNLGEMYPMALFDQDVTFNQLLCTFDSEKVVGVTAFYDLYASSFPDQWQPFLLDQSIKTAKEIKAHSKNKFKLFLSPDNLDAQVIDDILGSNPELFNGIGEIAFYSPPQKSGVTPDDSHYQAVWKVAAKYHLPVMFHPGDSNPVFRPAPDQEAHVAEAIKDNPNVKFLLHGYQSKDYISDLMNKYSNVYYSIDSATLFPFEGMFVMGPKEAFIARFKNDFNSQLQEQVNFWKPQIEKYPDRFMWGTDRAEAWHFDKEVEPLFEEFGRAFAGRLDPSIQEKYAYRNAENLFKESP